MESKLGAVMDICVVIVKCVLDVFLVCYDIFCHPKRVTKEDVVKYVEYRMSRALVYLEEGRDIIPDFGEEPVIAERALYRKYNKIIMIR